MQCLLAFFSSQCNYDSFVDYLPYGKQDHIDTSQLSFIVKVENFYDVEDILVVCLLFVSVTKRLSYTILCVQQLVL